MDFSPAGSIPVAPEQDRLAQRGSSPATRQIGVGARHHTVPAFYLRRFVNSDGRLLVRDRPTGRLFPSTASSLAIKDFYTVVSQDATFDGRMEQLLAKVEGEAAQLLKLVRSPYRKPGPLTQAEQFTLCQFVAFQMVRGPRKRREVELQADYAAKLHAGDKLTEQDLREITAVPHPNEHIRLKGPVSYAIFLCLLSRPVQIARIDAPLLVTGDEPVLVDNDDDVQHTPTAPSPRKTVRNIEHSSVQLERVAAKLLRADAISSLATQDGRVVSTLHASCNGYQPGRDYRRRQACVRRHTPVDCWGPSHPGARRTVAR